MTFCPPDMVSIPWPGGGEQLLILFINEIKIKFFSKNFVVLSLENKNFNKNPVHEKEN